MEPPVKVVHLFPVIDAMLIALLKTLTPADWQLQTLAKQWVVRDVAAHLLDGNMRVISANQQYAAPTPQKNSYEDLLHYLNDLNAVWVKAIKRVSPQLLVEMLETTGSRYSSIMAAEPLFEPARFSVAWAGEETSVNWFHIAREYTEKMHHQLQIRHAVNREEELMTRELFYPFIDTLMYGLPHTLRNTIAADNAVIAVTITGEAGGDWFVKRMNEQWVLSKTYSGISNAHVYIKPSIAWKLFTKGLTPAQAADSITIAGDNNLGKAVLNMVAVMA